MKQILSPTIDNLRLECVLVQAWKKTAAYLRTHSWYADTLEIDYQSLRLPKFIAEIQERLEIPETWLPVPLELVPAPKSQRWKLSGTSWEPEGSAEKRIRPLAHVGLQDQVLATAMLLFWLTESRPRPGIQDFHSRMSPIAAVFWLTGIACLVMPKPRACRIVGETRALS